MKRSSDRLSRTPHPPFLHPLSSSCTGPLNGFGTFRRRSAPPSTPFTAAPSPSGLALPAAPIHAAHLLKKQRTATLRESLQLPHKCKLSNVWSSATGKTDFGLFVLFSGRTAAAAAFCPVCGWAKRPRTDGWMMGGCYVGKWAGARRHVGRACSYYTTHIPTSLPLFLPRWNPTPLCVLGEAIAVRCGPPARRDSGAPRDATPKHLHEGS